MIDGTHIPIKDRVKYYLKIGIKLYDLQKAEKNMNNMVEILGEHYYCNGKNPKILAGVILYVYGVVTGEGMTQKEISEDFGMAENTIRANIKKLREFWKGQKLGRPFESENC